MTHYMNRTPCGGGGYRANVASKIWRRISRKESEQNILRRLRKKNLGTARVEEFFIETNFKKAISIFLSTCQKYVGRSGCSEGNLRRLMKLYSVRLSGG